MSIAARTGSRIVKDSTSFVVKDSTSFVSLSLSRSESHSPSGREPAPPAARSAWARRSGAWDFGWLGPQWQPISRPSWAAFVHPQEADRLQPHAPPGPGRPARLSDHPHPWLSSDAAAPVVVARSLVIQSKSVPKTLSPIFSPPLAAAETGASGGGGGGVSRARPCRQPVARGQSCTMGVRSRRSNPKRRRAATVSVGDSGGGGGVDLISGLSDDLLLRILDLVPDADNVVRTHALSRRWRGLWTGVAALRFDFSSWRKLRRSDAAAERYIAFVNGALALRAAAAKEPAFVEDLAISFDVSDELETGQLVPRSVEAAQGWIRYAVQHTLKSFTLKLVLPWRLQFDMDHGDNGIEHHVMTLDEMGNGYAKMETMHLRLGGAELRLHSSSTAVFPSLVDLSLEDIEVPAASGHLLSRLVSSPCCPRLHKLRLSKLSFERSWMEVMLHIEADTLLELSLGSMFGLQFLELRTPSLQVLHIDPVSLDLNRFKVSAPRLENLKFLLQQPLHIEDVHGQLSNVGTLMIQMFSHGETDTEDRNDASIHLLQCCRLTRCLEVSFEIPKTKDQTLDIIEGRIPLLPHVTHLTVDIKLWERHSTGPGVACLLAQCSNIKYLRLKLWYIIKKKNQSELDLLCDNNSCHWRRSHEFSLDHLEKVEFKELMGTDCEFQFIQSILTKATGIRKVTISFDRLYWQKGRKRAFKLMPSLEGGLWTTCNHAELCYKWRRCL